MGKPTTEAEFPLIDAAAEAGCEYFCIDCGWYADGDWWDSVGEWKESRRRFPNGVREVTDYIRKKGMIPGVWLELEVMGICCETAKKFRMTGSLYATESVCMTEADISWITGTLRCATMRIR